MSAFRWTCEWARRAGVKTLATPETGSTNADAKVRLAQFSMGGQSIGQSIGLIVTEHQTLGRGRADHVWLDSAGSALLSSWILHSEKPIQPIFSALVGLAAFEAASKAWPKIAWALKAPNDLYVVDAQEDKSRSSLPASQTAKKIGGLLIEAVTNGADHYVIIGLGLNTQGAPQDTQPYPATHLCRELQAKGLLFTPGDWDVFLNTWKAALPVCLDQSLVPEMDRSVTDRLAQALRHHPEFRELKSVSSRGDLEFSDPQQSRRWADL